MVDQSADLVTKEFLRAELAEVNTRSAQLELRLTTKISEVETKLTTRINEVDEKLTTRINEVDEKLTTRINEVDEKLTTKISEVDQRLTAQISALAVQTARGFAGVSDDIRRQQAWMFGTIISVAVLVVAALGLLAKLILFP